MKSLLAFWMGWSLGFLALSTSPTLQAASAVGFAVSLAIWLGVDWLEGIDK